ncbi:uncharacterized protein [Setaria viridis]|uniref:uncharacterized protein n=1 Tax=Setaria viridis TaxID=4556 RepID=UPI003B3BD9AD
MPPDKSPGPDGFRCINGALLTLIPKKSDAQAPKDYRPSAFIKGRSILDNYKYVQRSAAILRKRKVPKLLLKLDISKASDTVAWQFELEVLQAWGFGSRWRDWISLLLSTGHGNYTCAAQRPGRAAD